jgi:hypothetical protein
MGQVLYDLLKGRNLVLYPDTELRQQALNAVAVEKARGFAIRKERASRKIDGVVALAIACVAAVESGPARICEVCFEPGCSGLHVLGTDRYPIRPQMAAATTSPRSEREGLWRVVEPLLVALDAGDEAAASRAVEAVEAHVATVERTDAAAGARVRALLGRIEHAIEGRLDVA